MPDVECRQAQCTFRRTIIQQGQSTIQQIETILPQLAPPQLELVLAFAEFAYARAAQTDEDEKLWLFVEREQRYRAACNDDLHLVDIDYVGAKSDELYPRLGLERPCVHGWATPHCWFAAGWQ